jgi:biopolymer transport protein ExbD
MGMGVGGAKGGVKSEINVTPLVDVVLVLLIIFMVMTPLMLKELGINVPKKENVEVTKEMTSDQLVVSVSPSADGKSSVVQINNETVDERILPDKMHDLLSQRRDKIVFFNVNDDANYGDAVRVMDIVRGAGAKVLGIMTKN